MLRTDSKKGKGGGRKEGMTAKEGPRDGGDGGCGEAQGAPGQAAGGQPDPQSKPVTSLKPSLGGLDKVMGIYWYRNRLDQTTISVSKEKAEFYLNCAREHVRLPDALFKLSIPKSLRESVHRRIHGIDVDSTTQFTTAAWGSTPRTAIGAPCESWGTTESTSSHQDGGVETVFFGTLHIRADEGGGNGNGSESPAGADGGKVESSAGAEAKAEPSGDTPDFEAKHIEWIQNRLVKELAEMERIKTEIEQINEFDSGYLNTDSGALGFLQLKDKMQWLKTTYEPEIMTLDMWMTQFGFTFEGRECLYQPQDLSVMILGEIYGCLFKRDIYGCHFKRPVCNYKLYHCLLDYDGLGKVELGRVSKHSIKLVSRPDDAFKIIAQSIAQSIPAIGDIPQPTIGMPEQPSKPEIKEKQTNNEAQGDAVSGQSQEQTTPAPQDANKATGVDAEGAGGSAEFIPTQIIKSLLELEGVEDPREALEIGFGLVKGCLTSNESIKEQIGHIRNFYVPTGNTTVDSFKFIKSIPGNDTFTCEGADLLILEIILQQKKAAKSEGKIKLTEIIDIFSFSKSGVVLDHTQKKVIAEKVKFWFGQIKKKSTKSKKQEQITSKPPEAPAVESSKPPAAEPTPDVEAGDARQETPTDAGKAQDKYTKAEKETGDGPRRHYKGSGVIWYVNHDLLQNALFPDSEHTHTKFKTFRELVLAEVQEVLERLGYGVEINENILQRLMNKIINTQKQTVPEGMFNEEDLGKMRLGHMSKEGVVFFLIEIILRHLEMCPRRFRCKLKPDKQYRLDMDMENFNDEKYIMLTVDDVKCFIRQNPQRGVGSVLEFVDIQDSDSDADKSTEDLKELKPTPGANEKKNEQKPKIDKTSPAVILRRRFGKDIDILKSPEGARVLYVQCENLHSTFGMFETRDGNNVVSRIDSLPGGATDDEVFLVKFILEGLGKAPGHLNFVNTENVTQKYVDCMWRAALAAIEVIMNSPLTSMTNDEEYTHQFMQFLRFWTLLRFCEYAHLEFPDERPKLADILTSLKNPRPAAVGVAPTASVGEAASSAAEEGPVRGT